ncbi:thioredoxin [Fusobacterium sp. CAG:439]|nr:thioredoxin [Fusobacterium sp. CAG:439]HIT91583.1 thioredoxin family protein [Candidatus Stercorousia faecigallinarum]
MRKNVIIISLIFAIPLMAYMALTASNSTTAQTTQAGKPEVIKFTSAMCLDCQTMNKIFKEIFPKYENKIVLTEIQVQDKNSFNEEQIKKYNVTLVPTIVLLNSKGQQVKRIEGAVTKEQMDSYLQGLE